MEANAVYIGKCSQICGALKERNGGVEGDGIKDMCLHSVLNGIYIMLTPMCGVPCQKILIVCQCDVRCH